ncbi:probable receptor-like protein kinase At5g20050 [Miscanthus floridulus]|uniref:probable receptor-like protein kinase At5g20050 n=1 Tax=Miscanthus floridulus TaxID=154761 RepID=UPI00345A03EF
MSGSGLDDSSVGVAPRRGCCCACASVLCKIVKVLLHVAIVFTVFILIIPTIVDSIAAKIALQSVSFAVIACLYICTSSDREGRIISGVFLGVLAVVIVTAAPSVASKDDRAPVIVMLVCNLIALLVYCIWKISSLVQACLRRLRARGKAPAADPEAPLATMLKPAEAASTTPVQQTTFHIEDLPRKFSYDEIRAVTGDFGTVVGRGGSAEVFRGLLDDGTAVAVKRITSYKPVGEEEFLREISIVANVHQRSLVRLLGYCLVQGVPGATTHGQYLVYPFFENGSLDWWLFNGEDRRRLLPWPTRRRISVDVARALAYLHHECHRQILHLDIKPANILLDGGFRAHVSDFGISMSIAQDLTSVDTCGRGTPGYMAPEIWFSSLSTKSDVYSYGMTLLELVGGRRAYVASRDSSETPDFFARVVREKMARGELMELVDATMAPVDEGEVEALVRVALCCVQHQRELRPSMLTVVEMLEGRIAADLPPECRRSPGANFT